MRRNAWRAGCAALVVGLLVACGDSTAPDPGVTINIEEGTVTFDAVDATLSVTALATRPDGTPIELPPLTWSSSNALVASVTDSGDITAEGEGDAYVRAAYEGVMDSVLVQVRAEFTFTAQLLAIENAVVDAGAAAASVTLTAHRPAQD